MGMDHLPVEEFFIRLADLFNSRRKADHGSVFLTQKRLSYGDEDSQAMGSPPVTKNLPDRFDDLRPSSPLPVLIRATNGNSKEKKNEKIKLSTIVQPDALEAFYLRYADICKSGMQGLKKRDRSGRKKTKSKKRKVGVEGDRRV